MTPRILGSHFRADGRPKTGYVSERVAKREGARFGMTYYRCDFCDRFHLTSGADEEPPRRGGRGRGRRT